MQTRRIRTYILPMIAVLLLACSRGDNNAVYEHLSRLDAMLDDRPQAVSDSLKQLNPESLSRGNRAYYGLLKTIVDDKTYAEFTSDSLINSVQRYYNRHGNGTDAHIRSLVYQGIVRYRMEITDSTVLIPLKQAEQLFKKQKKQNPSIGYLMNYYLGEILAENNDRRNAFRYYNKALQFAGKENNNSHLFDSYLALFWSEMLQSKYNEGKLYLDTLAVFANPNSDAMYSLLNAQSIYYDTQGEYEKALEIKKRQKNILSQIKKKADLFRIHYAISDRYKNLNQLDSAFYYGNLAIEHIVDTTYILNYVLYENMADIAEKKHDYITANEYRRKAAEIHEQTIRRETDTRVLELEKQYNLTEAENSALRAQRHSRFFITTTIIAVLFMLMLYMYFSKQKALVVIRNKQLEAEKNAVQAREAATQAQARELEAKTRLIQQQTIIKEQMLHIYGAFLKQYAEQQSLFKGVTNKLRGKMLHEPADLIEQMLKSGQREFSTITAQLFTAEKLRELLNIHSSLDYLNDSERLILFMLACKAENKDIAALLNTTPISLKARKTQLKKKITDNVKEFRDSDTILSLF